MTDIEKSILDKFDGLELRTTQGRPPYDIVVNKKSVKDFLRSALKEYANAVCEEVIGVSQRNAGNKILCDCDCKGAFCISLIHLCDKPNKHYPQRDQAIFEIKKDYEDEQRKKKKELLNE